MLEMVSDDVEGKNRITEVSDAKVVINGGEYFHSIVINPTISEPKPWTAGYLNEDFVESVEQVLLSEKPQVLLIGTNHKLKPLTPKLYGLINKYKVPIELMTLQSCAHTYNILISEARVPAAILIFNHEAH